MPNVNSFTLQISGKLYGPVKQDTALESYRHNVEQWLEMRGLRHKDGFRGDLKPGSYRA